VVLLRVDPPDAVIREISRLGMLIDLAHGTLEDVGAAVDVSTKPMIVSHADLQNSTGWPRYLSPEHARLVSARGGDIGSMPVAIGVRDFDGFIGELMRLIDGDVVKILGGNFRRVFRDVTAA
jgi:membrane dipeptidase